jgi:iron complex transport system ATP-binding protein
VNPAIYAHGVTVVRGGRAIVDGVDVTVGRGDWIAVVGPNGAGKTTLLHALAGLTPASGRIELDGTPLAALGRRERARLVALVPQTPHIPPGMTVAHYVLLGRTARLRPLGRESGADLDEVDRALDQLALLDLAGRAIDTLSGGERQRAVLARALAQQAPLLLLDEPTSALDIGHQQDLLDLVDRLRLDRALTVVATMHDLTLTAQYADHLLLMDGGRVSISGPPVQVLTDSQLSRHYGARVDVIRHHGELVVVPWRHRPGVAPPADVHSAATLLEEDDRDHP